MFLCCFYKGFNCPLLINESDLVAIIHYTESLITDMFKAGISKKEQIEGYKSQLDLFDKRIENNDYSFTDNEGIFYWADVLALLRLGAIKDDKFNGLSRLVKQEDYKKKLKQKLYSKLKR